jgi:predicted MFS family arabinose efflux permease
MAMRNPTATTALPPAGGPLSSAKEWARGWPAVGGSMLGLVAGMNTFTVTSGFFVKPLGAEFGWSRGQIALSGTAIFLCSCAVPVSGAIADRFGARVLVAIGSAGFAACYLAFAGMTGEIWQYLSVLAVVGLVCGPATVPPVLLRPVAIIFDRSRGLAMAVMMSGFPLLSFVLLPTLQSVIATRGWRVGFLCLAPLALALGAASWLLLASMDARTTGDAVHLASKAKPALPIPGVSLRQAVGDIRFWLLALAMVAVNFSVGIFLTTLQPMLSDRGLDGRTGAFLGVWLGATTIVGRMSFGALLDCFWPPLIGCIALAAPLFGLLIFRKAGSELMPLAASIALVALAYGAENDLLALLTSRYFGLRAFGAVLGALSVFFGLAFAFGTVLAGVLFDRFGNYDYVLLAGAGLSGIAAAAVLASGLARRPAGAHSGATY